MTRTLALPRPQTWGEELANAISHGVGLMLAVASLPILLLFGSGPQGAANLAAASVFAASMMLLYLVSTLYHALPAGRAKVCLQRLDHAAIYIFIAGSYTPFTLGALRGGWGWTLFGLVWGLAAAGVVVKLLNRLKHPLWSTALYLAMGWVVLIAVVPLVERMSATGLVWLVVGGVSYSLGALVYLIDSRLRYAHFVWHLFVIGGSVCHVFAALWQLA